MSRASLNQAIAAGLSLVLDSSAVLAYLAGDELASTPARHLFDDFIRPGRNSGSISSLTVTETLVRPFERAETGALGTVEAFLRQFPNLEIVPVDYAVAREAARVRARTRLPTPDAIILATAIVHGAGALVGNDARWRGAIQELALPISLCLLEEHASPRCGSHRRC